jgi:hypothetical protein
VTPPIWVVPHDAQAKSLGTGRSIEALARNAGWRARIVPRLSVADGINAVRTIFPVMWFDSARCAGGLQALRYYRFDVDPTTRQFSRCGKQRGGCVEVCRGRDAGRAAGAIQGAHERERRRYRKAEWRIDAFETAPQAFWRASHRLIP